MSAVIDMKGKRFGRLGETHCIAEWAEMLGISKDVLYARRHRHQDWNDHEILFGKKEKTHE